MHMYSRLFWEAFSGSQHKKKGLEKRGKDKKKKKKRKRGGKPNTGWENAYDGNADSWIINLARVFDFSDFTSLARFRFGSLRFGVFVANTTNSWHWHFSLFVWPGGAEKSFKVIYKSKKKKIIEQSPKHRNT